MSASNIATFFFVVGIGIPSMAGLGLRPKAALAGVEASTGKSAEQWVKARIEAGKALAERKVEPGSPNEAQWYKDIKALFDETIDWETMTRDALGTQWNSRSKKEKSEFSTLLREMIEASYQSKLRLAARGELKKPTKLSIDWLPSQGGGAGELASDQRGNAKQGGADAERARDSQGASTAASPSSDAALMISADVRADKQRARLGFKVHRAKVGWRVIDVSIDDVSTVRTYRSQFRKLIAQEGFEGLLTRMRKKTEDIRSGRADLAP
ncbi:MAG: ABC transporter substrate-binding protein [Deltaproteobacteria bacterium]|nr:ABC transporter substrate-binding protein [Deltaproteobacteria bacterium]